MKQNMTQTIVTGCFALALTTSTPFALAPQSQPTKGATEMSQQELRDKLTPEQYRVTQKDGTERAFQNEYWDNHEAGIYVDIVSGEPLFASRRRAFWPTKGARSS